MLGRCMKLKIYFLIYVTSSFSPLYYLSIIFFSKTVGDLKLPSIISGSPGTMFISPSNFLAPRGSVWPQLELQRTPSRGTWARGGQDDVVLCLGPGPGFPFWAQPGTCRGQPAGALDFAPRSQGGRRQPDVHLHVRCEAWHQRADPGGQSCLQAPQNSQVPQHSGLHRWAGDRQMAPRTDRGHDSTGRRGYGPKELELSWGLHQTVKALSFPLKDWSHLPQCLHGHCVCGPHQRVEA